MALPRAALLSAVLLLPSLSFADEALIWSSETTEAKAQAQLERARAAIPAIGLVLSEGWPRVIKSADYIGLKPGYFVVLIGVCEDANAALPLLLRAKAAQRVAYTRTVEAPRDARCPTVDDTIAAKQVPGWVVLATGMNKAQLERQASSFSTSAIELSRPPEVLDTRGLQFAVPPGRKAERYLLALGVCDLVEAEVIAAAVSSGQEAWVAWALEDPPMACPALKPPGVARAVQRAVSLGDTATLARFAKDFPGDRAALFSLAVEGFNLQSTRALLKAWGPSEATRALGTMLNEQPTDPSRVRLRGLLLEELLKAGVKPGSRAIDLAVFQRNLAGLRAALDAGARPEGALSTSVLGFPEGLKLLSERKLVPADQFGELLVTALSDATAVELLLSLGAPLSSRGKYGVGALDLAMIFLNVKGRQNLLSRDPALAAAAAGNVDAAAKTTSSAPNGWTPLLVAVASKQLPVVRALLAAGASASSRVSFPGNPLDGIDALSLAIDQGDAAIVEALVKAGADLNATSGYCCEESTQSSKWKLNRVRPSKDLRHFQPADVALHELRNWGDSYESYRPVQLTPLARAATLGRVDLRLPWRRTFPRTRRLGAVGAPGATAWTFAAGSGFASAAFGVSNRRAKSSRPSFFFAGGGAPAPPSSRFVLWSSNGFGAGRDAGAGARAGRIGGGGGASEGLASDGDAPSSESANPSSAGDSSSASIGSGSPPDTENEPVVLRRRSVFCSGFRSAGAPLMPSFAIEIEPRTGAAEVTGAATAPPIESVGAPGRNPTPSAESPYASCWGIVSLRFGARGSTVCFALTATHDVTRVEIWKSMPVRSICGSISDFCAPVARLSSKSSTSSRAKCVATAALPSPCTLGFTWTRSSISPSALRARTMTSPPSGRSLSDTIAGAPPKRSGTRAGADDTTAEPVISTSVSKGALVRAISRFTNGSTSSPRPITSSTPRPARAAGIVRLRFTPLPTPTVCTRAPFGSLCATASSTSLSKPINPSVMRTT
jgi:hypothetical protein